MSLIIPDWSHLFLVPLFISPVYLALPLSSVPGWILVFVVAVIVDFVKSQFANLSLCPCLVIHLWFPALCTTWTFNKTDVLHFILSLATINPHHEALSGDLSFKFLQALLVLVCSFN